MFGYVVAERSSLTEAELLRYQSCYCGLCRIIGREYGAMQRLALNYDMTFLVLLLSSLYEPEETAGTNRCAVHPLKARDHWHNEATRYAAAMNMALAYHNCMDDWHDDRQLKALLQASLFRGCIREIAQTYPRQWDAIVRCMEQLSAIEKDNIQEPDAGANAFGTLMGELFVWRIDRWEPLLRKMGENLGRCIYLMDALLDLPNDIKNNAYNPFLERYTNGLEPDSYLPVLNMLMGECTDALERMPLLQDLELLRNILYSGIWTRFAQNRSGKEEQHVR